MQGEYPAPKALCVTLTFSSYNARQVFLSWFERHAPDKAYKVRELTDQRSEPHCGAMLWFDIGYTVRMLSVIGSYPAYLDAETTGPELTR